MKKASWHRGIEGEKKALGTRHEDSNTEPRAEARGFS